MTGHLGDHQAQELADALRPERDRRSGPEPGPPDADHPDREVAQGTDHGPDRRPEDAHAGPEQHRSGDDAPVVHERCQPIGDEAALGDQDLAQDERGREDHRGDAHDPEQLDVQVALVALEAGCDQVDRLRGEDEQECRGDRHDRDRHRQDGPTKGAGRLPGFGPQADEDRHEGRHQTTRDEDVQGQLGQDERGVVGVERGSGAERVGEHPVADEAHQVAGEGQDREDQGAPWQGSRQHGPGPTGDLRWGWAHGGFRQG